MRRILTVTFIGIALSVALVAEALAAPNANVTDRIKQGESVTLTFINCYSDEDYSAFLDFVIRDGKGVKVAEDYFAPEESDDRDQGLKFQLNTVGNFIATISCQHKFEGGGDGTYWTETEEIVVTGLTTAERKKCANKNTKKQRKRCRRKQAAD